MPLLGFLKQRKLALAEHLCGIDLFIHRFYLLRLVGLSLTLYSSA
jgi:hypothetical protein